MIKRAWEVVLLLIVAAAAMQWVTGVAHDFLPVLVIFVILGLVANGVWRYMRRW